MTDPTFEVVYTPPPAHHCAKITGDYPIGTELKCTGCGKVRRSKLGSDGKPYWGLVVASMTTSQVVER